LFCFIVKVPALSKQCQRRTSPYLVSHRQVLTVLRAAADPSVQALVDVAVALVGAVAAVAAAVAQAALRDAAAVGAHEEGAVAQTP